MFYESIHHFLCIVMSQFYMGVIEGRFCFLRCKGVRAIKIVSLRETELQKILMMHAKQKMGGKEKFMSITNFDYEDGASIFSLQGYI